MINAIFAADEEWGIGKTGTLPWPKNKADMKWFKETTVGCPVIMGTNTWNSLPIRPLPNRRNIIVSNSISYVDGGEVMNGDPISILQNVSRSSSETVWLIGGAQLLLSCLPVIDHIWISNIRGIYGCDVFLPKKEIAGHFAINSIYVHNGLNITEWRRSCMQ